MAIFLDKLRSIDDLLTDTEKTLPTIKTEMIDIQKDDAAIQNAERVAGELLSAVRSGEYSDPRKAYNNAEIRQLVTQYETILANRFGFPKLTIMPDKTFCCYIAGAKHVDNTISSSINEMVDAYKQVSREIEAEYKEVGEGTANIDLDNPDIVNSHDDYEQMLAIARSSLKSINSLTNELNSFGVTIDRKNAVIKNLPKDFRLILMLDICDKNLDAREFVALTLHEIGHGFNNIEYSCKVVNNTSVLVDTFLDNIGKRNKSPKESLLIAYNTAFKDPDADKLKNQNTVSVFLYVMSRTFKYNMGSMTPSEVHSYNDAEQLADQFAGRFGYGDALGTGLSKVVIRYTNAGYLFVCAAGVFSIIMYAIFLAIPVLGPLFIILGPLVAFFGLLAALSALETMYNLSFEVGEYQWTSYDDLSRRLQRMRNELVRQLREYKSDAEYSKVLLKRIDDLDKLKQCATDGLFRNIFTKFRSPLSKMLDLVFSSRRTAINIKRIEQIQEDLNSNELYVASAKLNQIKGV